MAREIVDKIPTIASIGERLAKVEREVRSLASEVEKLTRSLNGFKKKHPLPRQPEPYLDYRHRARTDEPRSEIDGVLYEYRDGDDLAAPTKTLLAIAKALDNALMDVRASRADINAIANDSDLRADFKVWQSQQKER